MKKIFIIIIGIIVIFMFILNFMLITNKTFYKTTYKGVNGEEFYIPRFSYFDSECCMTAATFYSLKSKKLLQQEIENYLQDFIYFTNDNTYGYLYNDLFIQSYEVIDLGLYRKIIITY